MEVVRAVWLKERLNNLGKKVDKKALAASIGLMLISWAALPIVYWLIVRKKKPMEEVKTDENSKPLEVGKNGKSENKEGIEEGKT